MQRIFITHIVPRNKIIKYNISTASCNFCYNLIEGGIFDKTYSIMPSFVRGYMEPFDGLVYSSYRRGLFYRISPIIENLKLISKIPRDASIWYYNCTILNVTLILLLKILKPKVKQQIIILDYTPSKKLFDKFLLWVSNHVNGTICLANSPLFTCPNSVCMPGVVPLDAKEWPKITSVKKSFLISGALGYNISMLPMLLEAFSRLPEMELHITGKASDLKLVSDYTTRCNNIIYHGMVSYDEYLRILHDTPFLLSTRNPDAPENQCNFPSKIIEALLHNRIVVSTLHYPQLSGIEYVEVPAQIDGFVSALRDIAGMSQDKLLIYANQSVKVGQRFNTGVWKSNMENIECKCYSSYGKKYRTGYK